MNQGEFYASVEGDRYFWRNRGETLSEIEEGRGLRPAKRDILSILENSIELAGRRTLEIGCFVGDLLAHLRDHHNCDVVGVEASGAAVEQSKDLYSLDLVQGAFESSALAKREPENKGAFDLIVMDDVLGWIDRENLLSTVASVDWLCSDGGALFFRELYSSYPLRVKNHHYPSEEIYNYRHPGGHHKIFIDTGKYDLLYARQYSTTGFQRVNTTSRLRVWQDVILVKTQAFQFESINLETRELVGD